MAVFADPPYNLIFRQLIEVRGRAYNLFGWQALYSEPNTEGVTLRRVPSKMGLV